MTAEHLSLEAKMSEFAQTFPSVRNADGVALWDSNTLDRWATNMALPHGARVTAQFLLAVWDSNNNWKSGKFDLMEALSVWDPTHHRAFLVWVAEPWWA